jgi:hypothetical protein
MFQIENNSQQILRGCSIESPSEKRLWVGRIVWSMKQQVAREVNRLVSNNMHGHP